MNITLPVPPSLNGMYFNAPGRGRVKTTAYQAWRNEAVASILAQTQRDPRMGGFISVRINLPTNMRGDIDNRIKPILDALVASGRIDDDRNVQSITVAKTRQQADVAVFVEVA